MTIRTILVCLSAAVSTLFAAAACEIHNCEEGALCNEDWKDPDAHRAECTMYCGRLSVCGAAQARNFDDCLDACQERYQRLPEETRYLCACAERSSCGDVTEGRCSEPSGSGGSCNSCGNGGAPSGNGGASPAMGGETSGATCEAACDCPATQNCVAGHCVPL